MKLKMMKRSIVVLAAAIATMSTSAMAQSSAPKTTEPVSKSVQLSDAELDGITAGSALSFVVVFNRGAKTTDAGNIEHHITRFVPTEGKTFTLHALTNPAKPEAVTRCHGHCL